MVFWGGTLAGLQLAFTLTWVIYVAYLPELAIRAGIAKSFVPWILVADQSLFAVCDWGAGVFADRLATRLGRIGPWLVAITLVSSAAFIALPWCARAGAPVLIAIIVVWSASSSVLRAPPLVMVQRHTHRPRAAWFAGYYLFGITAANAVAPYVGGALAGHDPRLPFALSSVIVSAIAWILVYLERRAEFGRERRHTPATSASSSLPSAQGLLIAFTLFAVGFQIHVAVDSAPGYLRFVTKDALPSVMPTFWIGCSAATLIAPLLGRRFGLLRIAAMAGGLGAVAIMGFTHASSLPAMVVAQVLAGLAWGTILVATFSAASGTGAVVGAVFSVLAVATIARIVATTAELTTQSSVASALPYGVVVLWAVASGTLAALSRGNPLPPVQRG